MGAELTAEHRQRLNEASAELAAAQKDLDRVLSELKADTPRAQKAIISDVLKDAFAKLVAARAKLEQVVGDSSR